jgi:hypothetical protein
MPASVPASGMQAFRGVSTGGLIRLRVRNDLALQGIRIYTRGTCDLKRPQYCSGYSLNDIGKTLGRHPWPALASLCCRWDGVIESEISIKCLRTKDIMLTKLSMLEFEWRDGSCCAWIQAYAAASEKAHKLEHGE